MQLKNNRWIILIFIVVSLFVFFGAAPKREVEDNIEVPLYRVIEAFNLNFKIDPITDVIYLSKDNRSAIICISRREILYNKKILYSCCRREEDGTIFLTGKVLNRIIPFLFRRQIEWYYENGDIVIGNRDVKKRVRPGSSQKIGERYRAKIRAVIIDPGHGGKDPGGIGYKGIKEKDIVLKIAGYVKKYLGKTRRDIKIVMTRKKDEFISLEKRAEIANKLEDSIYISIHANVSYNSKITGYESYYLTIDPQDEIAREVANKENSVIDYEDVKGKQYLLSIINHIVDLEYRRESIKLAESIQNGINKNVGALSINRGVKGAYFYVLKAVKMPSVLVEVGFVTNGVEASHLMSTDYQIKVARGIAYGINNFIKTFEETNGFTEKN